MSDRIVVTGASSGIGREVALHFATLGNRLVLAARGEDALHTVAEECRRAGATDVLVHRTDITSTQDVEALVEASCTRFGGVDTVVQNAAVAAFGPFLDIPADVFDRIVETNVVGAANVAREAMRQFRRQGHGRLIVIGSLLGHAAVPYMSPYVVSKFAVAGLVRTLRQEARRLPRVTVHGIYPGAVDTPVYDRSANYFPAPPAERSRGGRGLLARVSAARSESRHPFVIPAEVSAARVARAVVRASRRRRSSERQIGWPNRPMLSTYRIAPRFFDLVADPLVRMGSFARSGGSANAGTVFEPAQR